MSIFQSEVNLNKIRNKMRFFFGCFTVLVLDISSVMILGASVRSVSFVNNCEDTVWLDFTAGAAPYSSPSITSCTSDEHCIAGSQCNNDNHICFWEVPVPESGIFRIDADGGSNEVLFPILDNDIIWSGNVRACVNGTCTKSAEECDLYGCRVNASSPISLAEFTFSRSSVDFYDISILNGFNIPLEFGPKDKFPTPNSSEPYNCGNPGGIVALTGYGACTWKFDPPDYQFKWVSGGGATCSKDADCDLGEICGMNDRGFTTCGSLIGYWSLDQFCGQNLDVNYPEAPCRMPLGYPNEGQTLWNLLGCVDVPSCYQEASGENCCGCVDWQDEIDAVSPLTETCIYSNPNWINFVKPYLQYLKNACPSAYTFPYDDHSSTYVCSYFDAGNPQLNIANYTISFCPK